MPDHPRPSLPLAGIRVADFSRVLAGPLATMLLADLGADVIKVERPETGDDTRGWGPPFVGEDAAYFLALNRNKRSVVLDLATEEGVSAARKLTLSSDVLVENFRPGLMARFGLDHGSLAREHPRLVYCSLTAFGDDDEAATRPGYDIIVQALSGLMSFTGHPGGEPTKVGVALLDVITGLYAAVGVLAALRERDVTGQGRHVSGGLVRCQRRRHGEPGGQLPDRRVVPERMGTAHPDIVPYQSFHANDRPFILAAGNDRLFAKTCEVVGHASWADDPRFATNEARVVHRDELIPMLGEMFARRGMQEWLTLLDEAGVPCAPIMAMDEVFATPEGAGLVEQVDDPVRGPLRLVASPIRFDGVTPPTRTPPPLLGEHDVEVRRELEDGIDQ